MLTMSLSTQPYKGARDFYPEDMRQQSWMFGVMRQVVERFGFEEYNAPMLEPLEIYAAKTGEEIVNEQTYAFEDRGGRKVAIRPEMTPSVSRLVAGRRQELAYPLRWYNIGNRWRYERPQRGRVREFWQLDVDIFGVEDISAEIEAIQVADAILQTYGATREMYTIRINSRKLTDALMDDYLGLAEQAAHDLVKLIDRMHKLEEHHFDAQLNVIVPKAKQAKVKELLKITKLEDLPKEVASKPSVKQLQELLAALNDTGITNAKFDVTLMRGFDYYTDVVFEVFDNDPENNRSMFGGGRYSGLVGLFGVKPVEAIGFAMGDVTMQNFLTTHKLMPKLKSSTDVYAIVIGDVTKQAQKVVNDLRGQGVNVAVDSTGRKLDKQIKAADKKNIEYVLFIGEKELESGTYKLKNLASGKEQEATVDDVVRLVVNSKSAA